MARPIPKPNPAQECHSCAGDAGIAPRGRTLEGVYYFVIPIFFGFLTGWVGHRKGSSFFIWFLAGFILPLIGLIAALASRNENEDPKRECPNCHKILPISAQVCMRCGEDLDYPDELLVPAGDGSGKRLQP